MAGIRFSGKNIICLGDSLDLAEKLLAAHPSQDGRAGGLIDFIYIDPPYFSGSDYSARPGARGGERVHAYTDRWEGGMDEYLAMLRPRLSAMRSLLKPTGLIAVHLDWHAVHYVKVMLDGLFGADRFVNELIWAYKSGGAGRRSFARKHDNILLYAKTADYYFRPAKERSYNRGGKPYRFKGVEEFEDEDGRWYTMVNRKDVLSVDMVGRTSSERTGYATQKPLALLNILIESCCPEGGLCADLFAGSGTLAEAAHACGRSFIICDSSPAAVDICRARMDAAGAEYEYIGSL